MGQRYEIFFKTTQLNLFFYSGSQSSVQCSCERSKKSKSTDSAMLNLCCKAFARFFRKVVRPIL